MKKLGYLSIKNPMVVKLPPYLLVHRSLVRRWMKSLPVVCASFSEIFISETALQIHYENQFNK